MRVLELGGWELGFWDLILPGRGVDGWTCTVGGSRGMSDDYGRRSLEGVGFEEVGTWLKQCQ